MQNIIYYLTFTMVAIIFFLFLFLLFGWRRILKKVTSSIGKIILTDNYPENIMELLPGLRHMGIQNMLSNSLRAESSDVLHRPLGSSKKWPHLDSITFIPAQTTPFPIEGEEEIDVKVTIGPKAKKPMQIDIPLMISGMAYGISLSDKARLALAQAANNTGTAINSGEGGVLPEELAKARKYILQCFKAEWSKEEALFRRADMIEIKLGQGALFGTGGKIPPQALSAKARDLMRLKDNEEAIIYDNFFDNQTLEDLKELVNGIRELTDGVPIGAKIGAGGKLEEDIDHLIEIGVDYIAIDGGQGASYGAPPILADDTGIPSLHAINRAARHIEKRNMRGQISLIASGGLLVPGHFLKMLALGADAVYVGSAILFSLSHTQNFKSMPFEPPTQLVWDQGKFKDRYKVDEGAQSVGNFLTSCVEEMKVALRAMGKRSLKELSKKALVSYDEVTASMMGIPFSFEAWSDPEKMLQTDVTSSGQATEGVVQDLTTTEVHHKDFNPGDRWKKRIKDFISQHNWDNLGQ